MIYPIVNNSVNSLVAHRPAIILLETTCFFKAPHPFSICVELSAEVVLELSAILEKNIIIG